MQILVDFIRAEQHWSPDTGMQENFLVFGFGGRVHTIPCSEEDVIEAIRDAAKNGAREHEFRTYRVAEDQGAPPDSVEAPPEAQWEVRAPGEMPEFGGDVAEPVKNPPVMFHNIEEPAPAPAPTQNAELIRKQMIAEGMASRPRSRDKLQRERLERMRTIAQTAPHNKGAGRDDMGNPLMAGGDAAAAPADGPTVVRRPVTGGGDDDPFRQG